MVNFINRTLQFVNKSFEGKLHKDTIDTEVENKLKELFNTVGKDIDDGEVKQGIIEIFDFISYANKYFDEKQPWALAKTDVEACNQVLYNCVNIISNVNTLLKPYLPFSCEKVEDYLNIENSKWEYISVGDISIKPEIAPLYERYDKKVIDEEVNKLNANKTC